MFIRAIEVSSEHLDALSFQIFVMGITSCWTWVVPHFHPQNAEDEDQFMVLYPLTGFDMELVQSNISVIREDFHEIVVRFRDLQQMYDLYEQLEREGIPNSVRDPSH